ncbi:MAG TPA: hypothetical protein VFY71_01035 [Planctomycetota bacterium]|nr:hypothetical protein [Planctomycetota bacterium]
MPSDFGPKSAENSHLSDLGCYGPSIDPCHLRLHDIGEVLRREGLKQGFVPLSEYKVGIRPGGKGTAKVDWVWRNGDGQVIAAFEIEGRDAAYKSAGHPSLIADHWKLMQLRSARKWLVLFQVDHDLGPKANRGGFDYRAEASRALNAMGPHDIRVAMDVDFWDPRFRCGLAASVPGA